jgi:hypothetical protein
MGGLLGDIEGGFSAVINGVEHVGKDLESLVDKAVGEVESLGIAVTGDIGWLIKFLIQAGEDPVSAISDLSAHITKVGGDVVGTLEQLASGIMSDGLMGFAQKKAKQALAPMQDALQKNSAQGPSIVQVHQTTLNTMRVQLDALTAKGNTTGATWQGPSADEMNLSFGNISDLITGLGAPLDSGGAQDTLNQICIRALEAIVVVGGILVVCEIVVTIIAAIPGLVTGPGDLAILGGGGALIGETLEAMVVLIGADLLVWLIGSIAIYVTDHVHSHSTTTQPTTPKGGNVAQASAADLPLNPGQVVPGGRIYIPPKSGRGQPVRKGKGFVDAKGNVWEWARGGAQHGGPHWDVQHPDGSHTNVAPNGKVIGKDNFPNNDSLKPQDDNNSGSNNGN